MWFESLELLQSSAERAGLPARTVRDLVDTARPALVMARVLVKDADLPIGSSKLCGDPDLPSTMPWPVRPAYPDGEDRRRVYERLARETESERLADQYRVLADTVMRPFPLAFLCQFDLTELSTLPGFDPSLPEHGRLLVFCDTPHGSWSRPTDGHWLKVIWDQTDVTQLDRREAPHEIQEAYGSGAFPYSDGSWREHADAETLRFSSVISVCQRWRDDLAIGSPQRHALYEWERSVTERIEPSEGTMFSDRLGGWPAPIQGGPEREAQLAFHGRSSDDRSAETTLLLRQSHEWQHVLTIGGESYNPARLTLEARLHQPASAAASPGRTCLRPW